MVFQVALLLVFVYFIGMHTFRINQICIEKINVNLYNTAR
ncbi:hypothetical protein yinte0001_24390 [Yersinia intermedia ATCC 29909]|nr:hypothetical protein yinte0001_24390 [Yersinia intermedia ATCC 29909]